MISSGSEVENVLKKQMDSTAKTAGGKISDTKVCGWYRNKLVLSWYKPNKTSLMAA